MPDAPLTLFGRVLLRTEVRVITGLHIGAGSSPIAFAGVDSPIARNPLTSRPYLPGSSLRGKMRALTERALGVQQNQSIGRARIHVPQSREEYDASPIGRLYGVPRSVGYAPSGPSRISVADAELTEESAASLARARTELPYAEVKAEVAIDRVTAEAVARQIERLPAGAVLGPIEIAFGVYESRDLSDFAWVVRGLQMVEDDYLGGHGTRGSGRVAFQFVSISGRPASYYRGDGVDMPARSYATLSDAASDLAGIEAALRSALGVPA